MDTRVTFLELLYINAFTSTNRNGARHNAINSMNAVRRLVNLFNNQHVYVYKILGDISS